MDLNQYLQLLKQNHPALQVQTQDGRTLNVLPTKKLWLKVDPTQVLQNQTVSPNRKDHLAEKMRWELKAGALEKKHLFMLDLVAANNWQRPIYFSGSGTETAELGLEPFLQLEGQALRLVPARNPSPDPQADAYVDRARTQESLLQKFTFRGLQTGDHPQEENFVNQVVPTYRRNFAALATAHLQAGDTVQAQKVLQACLRLLPDQGVPHNFESAGLVQPLLQAGLQKEAKSLLHLLSKRYDQHLTYYQQKPAYFERERQLNLYGLQRLVQAAYAQQLPEARSLETLFLRHYGRPQE